RTGHLGFTTLHTNDCPSTVARLFDMGIQPFLLSSALLVILAQRLGRRICKDCKQPVEGKEEDLVPYGHVSQGLPNVTFYRGKGCATCNFTGMKGRVAIYEVMPIGETLRDMILKNAATTLRAKSVIATSVQEKAVKAAAGATISKKLGGRDKDKAPEIYTRQFSTMIDAGLPIAQCLQILSEQNDSKTLRDVTVRIAADVQGGATLAESFGKYPKTFDHLFTNMLAVGESGGVLDVVLQRLSGYIEKAAKLKAKVKSAMVYPVTIIGVACLVIIFMMIFVLPIFANMFYK